jgi:hypothetical protein
MSAGQMTASQNDQEDLVKSKLAVASLVLFLAAAAMAQSAADREILTRARQAYYSLRTQGVNSFQCDVTPDWNGLLEAERKSNPAAADTAIKTLDQLHFVVSFGADGKSHMTHNELTGQSKEMNDALAQIYGGMEQMTSGFFDTWALFMVSKPFPETDTKFELQTVGALYTLHYLEGTSDVVTTMSKDLAITQMVVTTTEFHSSIHPTLTKSANGFVLSGYDADYDSGKPQELTHLNVLVDYQMVSGVEMLQKLDLKGSYGGSKFSVQLGFQGCQITRK